MSSTLCPNSQMGHPCLQKRIYKMIINIDACFSSTWCVNMNDWSNNQHCFLFYMYMLDKTKKWNIFKFKIVYIYKILKLFRVVYIITELKQALAFLKILNYTVIYIKCRNIMHALNVNRGEFFGPVVWSWHTFTNSSYSTFF